MRLTTDMNELAECDFIVENVFEDWKADEWKVVGFFAKRARGAMARHAIDVRATRPEALIGFDREGYAFAEDASEADRLVFRRRPEAARAEPVSLADADAG